MGRAHGIGLLVHLPIVFTLIWIEEVWQELSYQYYECLTQSCFPHPSKKCMHRPPAGDSPKHPSICLYMRDHHVTLWRRPPSCRQQERVTEHTNSQTARVLPVRRPTRTRAKSWWTNTIGNGKAKNLFKGSLVWRGPYKKYTLSNSK